MPDWGGRLRKEVRGFLAPPAAGDDITTHIKLCVFRMGSSFPGGLAWRGRHWAIRGGRLW